MIDGNAKEAERCVGKVIVRVTSSDSAHWTDPDGFILHFDDGSLLAVSAEEGQGYGYVTAEFIDKALTGQEGKE